jgi:hypothetical protein
MQIANKDKLNSATDSPIGRFSALVYPECLPDRLETVAFIIEASFLFDGMFQTTETKTLLI